MSIINIHVQIKSLQDLYNDLKGSFAEKNTKMVCLKKIIFELKIIQNRQSEHSRNNEGVILKSYYDTDKTLEAIANSFGCSIEDIQGKSRKGHIVKARHLFVYILVKEFKLSSAHAGSFVNRDHATVLSSCKRVNKLSKGMIFRTHKEHIYKQLFTTK